MILLKITLIILTAWIFTTIVYILASHYLTWDGFYYDTPVLAIIAWLWLVEFLAFFGFLITTIILW